MAIVDNGFINIAKEFLQMTTAILDRKTSNKGKIVVGEGKVILLTPSHIQFAVYGRGPGKKPPFDNILQFVKKENVKFEGLSERGTAFAIQASIAKKGTKNFVKNAPNALEEAIAENFLEFNKKLGDAVKINIQKEINKVVKENLFDFKKYAK